MWALFPCGRRVQPVRAIGFPQASTTASSSGCRLFFARVEASGERALRGRGPFRRLGGGQLAFDIAELGEDGVGFRDGRGELMFASWGLIGFLRGQPISLGMLSSGFCHSVETNAGPWLGGFTLWSESFSPGPEGIIPIHSRHTGHAFCGILDLRPAPRR